MSIQELKELIVQCIQDIVFEYNGKTACINPWNENKFEVGYDDKVKTYDDIDELLDDKLYDGKSLREICEMIVLE